MKLLSKAQVWVLRALVGARIDEGRIWKEAVRVMIQGDNRRYGFADGSCLERNEQGKYRVVTS